MYDQLDNLDSIVGVKVIGDASFFSDSPETFRDRVLTRSGILVVKRLRVEVVAMQFHSAGHQLQ